MSSRRQDAPKVRALACALLVVSLGCERQRASAHGDRSHDGAADVAPTAAPVRIGEIACPTLARCLEPMRGLMSSTPQGSARFAQLEGGFAFDRPAVVWVFATPPAATDLVLELPLRTPDVGKTLGELGFTVAGGGDTLTVQGRPARVAGDRLLVGTTANAVSAAVATKPRPAGPSDDMIAAQLDLDAVPEPVRAAWLARLQALADSEDGDLAQQLRRASRFESILDTVRDGRQVSASLRQTAGGKHELSFTVVPRAGSWLESRGRSNATLQSRLAAIVPAASDLRLTWVEADALRDEDRTAALASLDELEPMLGRVPGELGLPPGTELEVVPILQDVVALARELFQRKQFDWIMFVPEGDRSLVAGVAGFPHARVDGVLARLVLLLQRHEIAWVKSASSKKRGRHTIHEVVMVTPEKLRGLLGEHTTLSAGTEGDSLLVVLEGKRKKARLPGLLDALAKAKPVTVPVHELHVDPVPLVGLFAKNAEEKAQLAAVFAGGPDAFVMELRTAVEGTAMVTTFRMDLGAWFSMLARAKAQSDAKAKPEPEARPSAPG